jgi:hypothetical protein
MKTNLITFFVKHVLGTVHIVKLQDIILVTNYAYFMVCAYRIEKCCNNGYTSTKLYLLSDDLCYLQAQIHTFH